MKKVLISAIFAFAILFAFPIKAKAERVNNFDATYNLKQSGLVEVTERIEYDFGPVSRHGIYRYIPYRYPMEDGKTLYINISDIKVGDSKGSGFKFEKGKDQGNVVIKIGSENQTVTGKKTYLISYKVKGGLRYFDSGDEFYWNVTGTGWDVPIDSVSAKVLLEKPLEPSNVETECFVGSYGSNMKCGNIEVMDSGNSQVTSGVLYEHALLSASQGMTIALNTPAGTFEKTEAGFLGTGYSSGAILAMVMVALIFPILTFFFMLHHWWKYGRDPKGRGTIIAEYNAPDGLTPIEVGTLLDARVDNKDLTAEIIYLATQGYLKIRREPGKGVFKKDDYTLIKLNEGKGTVSEADQALLSGIFSSGNEVLISSLKDDFYTHLPSIKTHVHNQLVENEYFKAKIASTIGKYLGIATLVGLVGVMLGVGLGALTDGVGAFIFVPAFILSAIIVGFFGLLMPARTAKGVEAKEKVLGLKEYMQVAESDRIKFHNAPKKDPKQFEKLLPYAMVLGVEKEWAKQFENIYKGSPGWYDDPTGRVFMPVMFANNLSSFNSVVTKNMATAPSSSGSGFGGGGFSGGGFGGGGGGSW